MNFLLGFKTNDISNTKSALKYPFCKTKISFENVIVFGACLVITVPNLKFIYELYFELHEKIWMTRHHCLVVP